jgi:transposase
MELPPLAEPVRCGLPPEAQAYLSALAAAVAALREQVTQLQAQVVAQTTELAQLRAELMRAQARARQHSGTSSRPPSSDPPEAPKRPGRPPAGRRRGGQPGHRGHQRALLPIEAVDQAVVHRPEACPACETTLSEGLPTVGERARQQVWDIPPVVAPEVVEHRYVTVVCPTCQARVAAARPPEVPEGQFGLRTQALVGLLHGRYRLSMRETVALLVTLWRLPLSVGSVPRLCARVSEALAAPYAEAQAAVQASRAVHVDETGWRCAGRRAWLWIAASAVATLFLVATSRAGTVVTRLLGAAFGGIVHSDRFTAYRVIPVEQRQVCWAHLDRNFAAVAGWGGAIGLWGLNAQELVDQLFAVWHRYQRGELDRPAMARALRPVRRAVEALLARGVACGAGPVPGLAAELQALWPALWTFVAVPGVEPTNNAAERGLRPAVLRRKGSFGTQSDAGSRFVERLMTVSATCQQHQRPLFPFLVDALAAHQRGHPAPQLLPTP